MPNRAVVCLERRPYLLTAGHRTYGQGEHPHVDWDRKGEKWYSAHTCWETQTSVSPRFPKRWQDTASTNHEGLGKKRT